MIRDTDVSRVLPDKQSLKGSRAFACPGAEQISKPRWTGISMHPGINIIE